MYQAKSDKFLIKEVAPDDVNMDAGTLPALSYKVLI